MKQLPSLSTSNPSSKALQQIVAAIATMYVARGKQVKMPKYFFQRKKKGRDNPPTLQSI